MATLSEGAPIEKAEAARYKAQMNALVEKHGGWAHMESRFAIFDRVARLLANRRPGSNMPDKMELMTDEGAAKHFAQQGAN